MLLLHWAAAGNTDEKMHRFLNFLNCRPENLKKPLFLAVTKKKTFEITIHWSLYKWGIFINALAEFWMSKLVTHFYLTHLGVKWRHLLFQRRDAKTLFLIQNGQNYQSWNSTCWWTDFWNVWYSRIDQVVENVGAYQKIKTQCSSVVYKI